MMDAMMKMMNPALMVQMMNAMSVAMTAMPKMADDMNKSLVGTAKTTTKAATKAAKSGAKAGADTTKAAADSMKK
jgi:hypothetical protein